MRYFLTDLRILEIVAIKGYFWYFVYKYSDTLEPSDLKLNQPNLEPLHFFSSTIITVLPT